MKRHSANDVAFDRAINKLEIKFGEISEYKRKAIRDFMRNPENMRLEVDKEFTLMTFKQLDSLTEIFYGMNWTILNADTSLEFITSENPLVRRLDPKAERHWYRGEDLRDREMEVTLPLTKKACLFAHWRDDLPSRVLLQKQGIKEINRLQAVNAERSLYASHYNTGLRNLALKYNNTKPIFSTSGFGPEKFARVVLSRGKKR